MATFDDVPAHRGAMQFCVDLEMTPVQTKYMYRQTATGSRERRYQCRPAKTVVETVCLDEHCKSTVHVTLTSYKCTSECSMCVRGPSSDLGGPPPLI